MNAIITDIKKFAVHDGDGIRTTVFFKGCSLKCKWCHNPEAILSDYEIGFYEHKCILCGNCTKVCENHEIINGRHIFNRKSCVGKQNCVGVCLSGALVSYGKEVSTEEICKELLEDKIFYEVSDGGITLSGGECLLQPDACQEILIKMKEQDIHTAIDTCGMIPWENIKKVIDYTDVFLYDIKAIDEIVHKKGTGRSNRLILDNLKRIDKYGKNIEIRIPYIPDYNKNQMGAIADFVEHLENLVRVRVLAYHDYARSKYHALGITDTLPHTIPTVGDIDEVRAMFTERGISCIE